MKVLIVDCYDSFTYNLYQQVGMLGCEQMVVKNDHDPEDIIAQEFDRIILSPGPGRPAETGLCLEILATMSRRIPTLGICLGHQVICHAFGAEVEVTGAPVHGKTSMIGHDGTGIYDSIPSPMRATRYHSLAVREETLPGDMVVTARSADDGMLMGVRHLCYPVEGVQFHPESILTSNGDKLVRNFIMKGVCR